MSRSVGAGLREAQPVARRPASSPPPHDTSVPLAPAAGDSAPRRPEAPAQILIENISDLIVLMSADGALRYVSPSIKAMAGHDAADLQGRNFFDFVHPGDLHACERIMAELLASPGSLVRSELRCRHRNGSWLALEALSKNLLPVPDVNGIVVALRDITPRKAEQAQQLQLTQALRRAVERREFVLHYQPRIELNTGRINGVEALIRWNVPGHGLVAPAEFMQVLEETGMIVEVGEWALRRAVAVHRRWLADGLGYIPIAVNVSAVQLRQHDFADMVRSAVAPGTDRGPGIELELTESTLMVDAERVAAKLHEVRKLGVRVAIDDFGTGYSSLSYLARLPVDTLKMDRSFTVSLSEGTSTLSVVLAITALARSLKLQLVAEGVEHPEHVAVLRRLGCEHAQGFLFSKALPEADLVPLLRRGGFAPPVGAA